MLHRVALLLIALTVLAAPTPAVAEEDWDADDAIGPFDLRWVGATFTADGQLNLTVSFYDGFDPRALPLASLGPSSEPSRVHVWFRPYLEGWFLRRPGGGITFFWGESGHSWQHDPVRQPAPNVLVVGPFDPCDPIDPYVTVRVATKWQRRPASIDRIDPIPLGIPPGCDPAISQTRGRGSV